jgi:hypothetical protein
MEQKDKEIIRLSPFKGLVDRRDFRIGPGRHALGDRQGPQFVLDQGRHLTQFSAAQLCR